MTLTYNSAPGVTSSSEEYRIFLEAVSNYATCIYVVGRGYIGNGETLSTNWENPLALTQNKKDALIFTLSSDAEGKEPLSISDMMEDVPWDQDDPLTSWSSLSSSTIEILDLTPNSFQLLTNNEVNESDIANHYNISGTTSASLVSELTDVDKFCKKTGLTFNQLLELTTQSDYQTMSKEYESVYMKFRSIDAIETIQITEYGAVYLTGTENIPLWVKQYNASGNHTGAPVLNFTSNNVVGFASRAEKLVRLSQSTGLSFEQLDWLIVNANFAIDQDNKSEIKINKSVLSVLSKYVLLKNRFGIIPDMFAAFIGQINTYAKKDKESFYQSLFSSVDKSVTIPIGATLRFAVEEQGLYESICCSALGVNEDEFSRIGGYCFNAAKGEKLNMDAANFAQIYRMGKIPQMLGLNFSQAEILWRIMFGGDDNLLKIIGSNMFYVRVLDIIQYTVELLDWMDKHQLSIVSLQSMVTNQYSDVPTSELYNFLLKVYQSAAGMDIVAKLGEENEFPEDMLCRSLAAGFNLKVNVMSQIITWMDNSQTGFTFKDFWASLNTFFNSSKGDGLDALRNEGSLIRWCQQMSQYVLIVKWCGLSEQDLILVIDHPEYLSVKSDTVMNPSLYLLLLLSRLKEWQQRVQVSIDEAMQYFSRVNSKDISADEAIHLLARIHGWDEEYIASISESLLGIHMYPLNFEQVYALESWGKLGNQLNVGSRTLRELAVMGNNEVAAESEDLIVSLANSMIAGTHN